MQLYSRVQLHENEAELNLEPVSSTKWKVALKFLNKLQELWKWRHWYSAVPLRILPIEQGMMLYSFYMDQIVKDAQ